MKPTPLQRSGSSRHTRLRGFGAPFLGSALIVALPILAADSSVTTNLTEQLKQLSVEDLMEVKVDMVYGASKHEQKTTEAPSSVTIVTSDEIQKQGHRTLGDILRGVRGFYVSYDRAYDVVGVRGVNRPGDFGGRMLITVDGHRLNDPIYDSASVGTEFLLDVDLIDRVEVIRGPGSSLYGNNAFFGVINVITRKGHDVHGAELSVAAGSFDAYTGRVSYGNVFTNGVELLLSGTLYDSAGDRRLYYPEFSAINNGLAENMDGARAPSAFASISWNGFSLEGGWVDRRKTWPTAPYSTDYATVIFNDPRFFSSDERAFADVKFQRTLESDWEVMARVYYDHFQTELQAPIDSIDPLLFGLLNQDARRSESVGTEVQTSRTFLEKHRLTAGAEVRYDFQLSQRNFSLDPPITFLNSRYTARVFGLYAQDEFRVFKPLIVNAGLRYDHFSTFGDAVNPRAALIYQAWEPTTFKFLYGRAFRAPNVYEYYGSVISKVNPNLGPETIDSYELICEQRLGKHWSADASLFLNDIKGLIAYQLDPVDGLLYSDNLDSVQAKGVEVGLQSEWAGGLRGRASYTYTHTEDATTGRRLSNSPEHLGKFGLSVPLWRDKVFGSLEVQGMSRRETVQGGAVGGFWLANATLFSRELVKGVELSAGIYNLFDHRYSDPVAVDFTQNSIPQDGRSFRVKATYHF